MDILASVCLLALFSSVLGETYVSDDSTDWKTANTKCKLATPELIFSTDATEVNLEKEVNAGEYWIGYYQARTVFEYVGCAKKSESMTGISTKKDPGQCLSACNNSQMIGIYKEECFCSDHLGSIQDSSNQYCTSPCEGSVKELVCGGDFNSDSYISMYRTLNVTDDSIATVDSTNDENKKYCVHYDRNGINKNLFWDKCSMPYKIICQSGKAKNWIYDPLHEQTSFKWREATTKCFANRSIPIKYGSALVFLTEDPSPLWTGVIRSQVIYSIDTVDHLGQANEFGYIKIHDSGRLEFKTSKDQSKQIKRLCVNETESPDSGTSKVLSTTEHISTNPTNHHTTTIEMNSTYEPLKNNQEESSDVGAIVGATLTIVILIVIAIAAVIYVRKWGFTLPSFLKKEKREPHPANNNNAYVISRPVEIIQSSYKTDPETYAEIDLTTTSYNEGNKGGATGKAQEGVDEEEASPYSHDYFVLENVDEGQYDTTKDVDQNHIPKPNPNTFNPYNKLNFEQSSNYDHIGGSKGGNAKRHVSDSENTYNTTDTDYLKKSIGKTDNDYDTADGTEDDTYNHTNIQGHQKGLGTSENDYDAI